MALVAVLTDQMLTLLLGFALTTVAGGSLGYWFQRRNWEHQNDRTLAESDRVHATDTCRELSQLMDRRLYRMWQLKWALFAQAPDLERIDGKMQDYRGVLYEWNDTLNRNLAAAEIEFGSDLRRELEARIYEGFAAVGRRLEERYHELTQNEERAPQQDSSQEASYELLQLRETVYRLNVKMLRQIRDGRVGRHAPA